MPSNCVFEFDRPNPVYYSGETINGRINLTTTSNKSVNGNVKNIFVYNNYNINIMKYVGFKK